MPENLVTTIDDYSNIYVQNVLFYFYNLELDPMTLVPKLDLDMVVTYQHTKYEVNRSICLKGISQKDRTF